MKLLSASLYLAAVHAANHKSSFGSGDDARSLETHFSALIRSSAHKQQSTDIPHAAAVAILRMDSELFGTSNPGVFGAMLLHESTRRPTIREESPPHVLCAPQTVSMQARTDIAQFINGYVPMAYVSRANRVSCWEAGLTSGEAAALSGSSSSFFHVTKVPSPAKFSPGLVESIEGKLVPSQHILEQGLTIDLSAPIEIGRVASLIEEWVAKDFGLAKESDELLQNFFPMSNEAHGSPVWREVLTTVSTGACMKVFKLVKIRQDEFGQVRKLRLRVEQTMNTEWQYKSDDCTVAMLAFLATHSHVRWIQPYVSAVLATVPERAKPRLNVGLEAVMDFVAGKLQPLNSVAVTALLSGDSSNPNPLWSIGVNGTGQIVQVADTGLDDASCFFREEDSASFLSGVFNSNYQVPRSTFNNATTDFTRRKVLQYISRDITDSGFSQDLAAGHGTHCAGTVAGLQSKEGQVFNEDRYTNCADYQASCATWFCPTCSSAGFCDTTCGFETSDDDRGMAPGAKLAAYDFGDAQGNLNTPVEMPAEAFEPAYRIGARIFSNSWGSSAPYNYYDTDAAAIDLFIYDSNDALVIFSAGNSGDATNDDTYWTGDASIGSPAVAKNVLTVGAAETAVAPTTVASFSSRGPTRDMRLKPEVCAPGDPINSASASGSAGLATCAVTSKSGTSMATPAVAGAAALIRQYLIDGNHAKYSSAGYKGSSYNESNPSAALMKALLIGSTTPLISGYSSSGAPVNLASFYSASEAVNDSVAYALGTSGVDFTQGFGHVRLSNVFPLDGSLDTYLFEAELSAWSNWAEEFEVRATNTDVAITLVWLDPPGPTYCGYYYSEGFSANTCLVHDLDLVVTTWKPPTFTRLYSNFGAGDGTYSGQTDTLNNVEKTTIAAASLSVGTTVTARVDSSSLSYADTQRFAVVVTGNLIKGSNPSSPPSAGPSPTPTSEPTPVPTPQPTSHFCSSSSCEELASIDISWQTESVGNVCGERDAAPLGTCSGLVTWAQARTFCESGGARLCTYSELELGVGRGSGCSLDNQLIWSSNTCATGSYTIVQQGSGYSTCVSGDASGWTYGGCCADYENSTCIPLPTSIPTMLPTRPSLLPTTTPLPIPSPVPTTSPTSEPTVLPSLGPSIGPSPVPTSAPTALPTSSLPICSSSSCEELTSIDTSWQTESVGNVCGERDAAPLGTCSELVTWAQARTFCESGGARLCTHTELELGVGRGSGCSLDNQLIWSSNTCATGSYTIVQQGSGYSTCVSGDASSSTYGGCCADYENSTCIPLPTSIPTMLPTRPSLLPTSSPLPDPSPVPTASPTSEPTVLPSLGPSIGPSPLPTSAPTPQPTTSPLPDPSPVPTASPSSEPTVLPSLGSSIGPSPVPTSAPTPQPTTSPLPDPSPVPTASPSSEPTVLPSFGPSIGPSPVPTSAPTTLPTSSLPICSSSSCEELASIDTSWQTESVGNVCGERDAAPLGMCSGLVTWAQARTFCESGGARLCTYSELELGVGRGSGCSLDNQLIWSSDTCATGSYTIVQQGSGYSSCVSGDASSWTYGGCCADYENSTCVPLPTSMPTMLPTRPSLLPTTSPLPDPSPVPTASPTTGPTVLPSLGPSIDPSPLPSLRPSTSPSPEPTLGPSPLPTAAPTTSPRPSIDPSLLPTSAPTSQPTTSPLPDPSPVPTASPTTGPTMLPSLDPSIGPSILPTSEPTPQPMTSPSPGPSPVPTALPTTGPTVLPSFGPSIGPSPVPTSAPTPQPTTPPLLDPSPVPTASPTTEPTVLPSFGPSIGPSLLPTSAPIPQPTTSPLPDQSAVPTASPTTEPTVLPSSGPSIGISLLPTSAPTPTPTTSLSPRPSIISTASDLVNLFVSMSLTASLPPSEDDRTALKASVADAADVTLNAVREFALTSSTMDDSTAAGSSRRNGRLLATYVWSVSFHITTSLSSTASSSASAFQVSVTTSLTANAFVNAVASSASGAAVDTATVAAIAATRNPTTTPTVSPVAPAANVVTTPAASSPAGSLPEEAFDKEQSPGSDDDWIPVRLGGALGAAALLVVGLLILVFCWLQQRRQRQKLSNGGSGDQSASDFDLELTALAGRRGSKFEVHSPMIEQEQQQQKEEEKEGGSSLPQLCVQPNSWAQQDVMEQPMPPSLSPEPHQPNEEMGSWL